jgi:beta-glucosidase
VTIVESPQEADVVVVRIEAPFEERSDFVLEPLFHAGSLEFQPDVIARISGLAETCLLILDVRLERPAVLTPFIGVASVIIGSFGSSDAALAKGLANPALMIGSLPFELPGDMAAVEQSRVDVPDDLESPLFQRGHRAELHGTASSTRQR